MKGGEADAGGTRGGAGIETRFGSCEQADFRQHNTSYAPPADANSSIYHKPLYWNPCSFTVAHQACNATRQPTNPTNENAPMPLHDLCATSGVKYVGRTLCATDQRVVWHNAAWHGQGEHGSLQQLHHPHRSNNKYCTAAGNKYCKDDSKDDSL